MNKVVDAIAIAVILASIVGCGQKKTGGGSRSIGAGATARASVYGIRAGMKLGFLMFPDIPSEGTNVSAGLEINGTEYKFANGRVFLVSTKGDAILVDQLNVSISDIRYDAEIDRIVKLQEVQEFLTK